MTPREAGADVQLGRWAKAQEFAEAASLLFDERTESSDTGDAHVSLAVLAGIAASDVIRVAKLGKYSATGAHDEAITLLRSADPTAAKHLARLLGLKSKASYAHRPTTTSDVRATAWT